MSLNAGIRASSLIIGPLGWNFNLKAEILASKLGFGPQLSRLRFRPQGWDWRTDGWTKQGVQSRSTQLKRVYKNINAEKESKLKNIVTLTAAQQHKNTLYYIFDKVDFVISLLYISFERSFVVLYPQYINSKTQNQMQKICQASSCTNAKDMSSKYLHNYYIQFQKP